MPSRLVLMIAAALLVPAGASPQTPPAPGTVTVTTFVINGHGWGHGVGMSQWGAYGYAKRGVAYDRILAHFYPGTQLAQTPVSWIKALLAEGRSRVVITSQVPFRVKDGSGTLHDLAAGNYPVDSGLALQLDPAQPAQPLPGSLTFLPGKGPLWLAKPYRGTLIVSAAGKSLSVVNRVSLESYTRGVVSSEMPHDWPVEAVKAQAVAARSYALSHLRGGSFDVYSDTRDQVYGGMVAETPVGDQAVAGTKRQVLLYNGKVAQTFFFSSSGGRTAAVTDVFSGAKPIPYLVSVPDPYDTASPYHTWGPVVVPAASAAAKLHVVGLSDLEPVPATGRARLVTAVGRAGETSLAAGDVRRALGLRSTWFRVGVLSLSRPVGVVPPGVTFTLTGRIEHIDGVTLEQRTEGSDWQAGPSFQLQADGTFSVPTSVSATTQFRLSAGTVKSAILRAVVATS